MQFLIYDTETCGIPDWKMPSKHPDQPHLVSIGAVLADAHGEELERMHAIIRPDGWVIDEESERIHGISQERALAEGIPEAEAIDQLLRMCGRANVRVGYNEMFDRRIIRVGLYRHARTALDPGLDPAYGHGIGDIAMPPDAGTDGLRELVADWWNYAIPDFDVMAGMRAAMGIKKNPKLGDAYLWAFEREMPNAHSAIDDAHHTRELFQWLLDHDHIRLDAAWFEDKAAYKARKAAEKQRARPGYAPA